MNITLDQLKEIAKAGYGERGISEYIDTSDFEYRESFGMTHDEYKLYITDTRTHFSKCLTIYVDNDDTFIQFITIDGLYFNHLAAIRKMEELGIIEK